MTNYTIIQNADITSNLTNGAFRLYMLLQSMCYGNKDYCFPSQKTLGERLKKSVRTIQRYLKELIDNKLIKKRRRGSISNVYIILAKKVLQKVSNTVDKIKQTKNKVKKNKFKDNYKKDKNKFNDYDQRSYNFDKLEDLLLNGKGNLIDCEIEQE